MWKYAFAQVEPSEPPEKVLQKAMRCMRNLSCSKRKGTQPPDDGGGAKNPNNTDAFAQVEPSEPPEKVLQKAMRCMRNLSCSKRKGTQPPDDGGGAKNPNNTGNLKAPAL
ncbi:uncharacterized protein LOC127011035 isoform X2 [Drosophila biarmipes]|uniref:uncharacterized protein LOC127011035 isoform X2 n=1 Tax=Drosophila biarmipes TaxID=125945 RepID=UPI0021CD011E|nr:uncharacterized protein LOC127011035 isoform X2 [Drosophila biarmipes]XP_050743887.1 uncharacterized protein LOC127011035 isoform X2 [Drosophila biarmipes]XP_050743888.1 uncharacterized protein LOC127011035 isoform X2 [Drosophila biarmipes]